MGHALKQGVALCPICGMGRLPSTDSPSTFTQEPSVPSDAPGATKAAVSPSVPTPPPGWYERRGTRAYWNGTAWSRASVDESESLWTSDSRDLADRPEMTVRPRRQVSRGRWVITAAATLVVLAGGGFALTTNRSHAGTAEPPCGGAGACLGEPDQSSGSASASDPDMFDPGFPIAARLCGVVQKATFTGTSTEIGSAFGAAPGTKAYMYTLPDGSHLDYSYGVDWHEVVARCPDGSAVHDNSQVPGQAPAQQTGCANNETPIDDIYGNLVCPNG